MEVNGWSEWKNLVLTEQTRLNKELSEHRKEFAEFRLEMTETLATWKGQARTAGVVAGIGASLAASIVASFFKQ